MDIDISVNISDVGYRSWLRTSYTALNLKDKEGNPIIVNVELGIDQKDALNDFMEEATNQILKIFTSRQGDVSGLPYENNGTTVVYRFSEGEPALSGHITLSLTQTLTEYVKNALFSYVTYLWFQMKNLPKHSQHVLAKYSALTNDIERTLYRLHD